MTDTATRTALRAVPELAGIYALTRRGWQWTSLSRGAGALVGWFAWSGGPFVDWCVIRGYGEVEAVRVRDGDGLVWQRCGSVGVVAAELKDLPPPHAPGAPRLLTGRRWRPPGALRLR
ncbi:hypothetical protein C1701_11680 [Actinoalloteichus sp. AHMU CJ021]|uniref:hypothetical protein n=1 Tax=Actinoalloteichus TaxID=65496 RepID=UPI0004AA6F34|nr:hypothetical protein [Actinoalloteichus caeruleus]AUS78909.1 hypothetical protein C1701_11680 [Actinoalloteichus sp. AHMU CJ021]